MREWPCQSRRRVREWLLSPLDPEKLARIRAYMAQEEALGDARFQAMVEKALNRPAAVRPRGRLRMETGAEEVNFLRPL